ncbi:MAG: hypothetical protein M3220_13345, partial [Chloroflexota bacterium]|nr:hypothetical protein [Chloroflexota bacterium]
MREQAHLLLLLFIILFALPVLFAFRPRLLFRLVVWSTAWLNPSVQEYITGRIRTLLSTIDVLLRRDSNLRVALWSGVIWFTAVLNNYLLFIALGIEVPLT